METPVPTSCHATPSLVDGAYLNDLTSALSAAAVLASGLFITGLVVFATFKTVRLFVDALRLSSALANYLATALLAAAVIIGLLNR